MLIASSMIMRIFFLPQEGSNAVNINDFAQVRKFYEFKVSSPVDHYIRFSFHSDEAVDTTTT